MIKRKIHYIHANIIDDDSCEVSIDTNLFNYVYEDSNNLDIKNELSDKMRIQINFTEKTIIELNTGIKIDYGATIHIIKLLSGHMKRDNEDYDNSELFNETKYRLVNNIEIIEQYVTKSHNIGENILLEFKSINAYKFYVLIEIDNIHLYLKPNIRGLFRSKRAPLFYGILDEKTFVTELADEDSITNLGELINNCKLKVEV